MDPAILPMSDQGHDITSTRLVSAREITFLLDFAKGRKARLPSRALRLCQCIEAFKHRNPVLAQACRDRRTIREMLANGVEPDRAPRKEAAGAGCWAWQHGAKTPAMKKAKQNVLPERCKFMR